MARRKTDDAAAADRIRGLRLMLLERRKELQQEIDQSLAAYRTGQARMNEESAPDVEDQSLRSSTGNQRLSVIESRSQAREQIDEAIRRLDEGLYGICEQCGGEIGEARLQAVPFARRCLACQEEAEAIERIERMEDRTEF